MTWLINNTTIFYWNIEQTKNLRKYFFVCLFSIYIQIIKKKTRCRNFWFSAMPMMQHTIYHTRWGFHTFCAKDCLLYLTSQYWVHEGLVWSDSVQCKWQLLYYNWFHLEYIKMPTFPQRFSPSLLHFQLFISTSHSIKMPS